MRPPVSGPSSVAGMPSHALAETVHHSSTCRPLRLGDRLNAEWARLRVHRVAVRRAAGWAIVEGALHDLDQILLAVGHQTRWSSANEAAMRRLIAHAAYDELAARVAIQRILPGLLAIVRRRGGREGTLDELIGAAWIGVRTFDPTRRPACLAAALVADADYRAFRMAWRRRSTGELPAGVVPRPLQLVAEAITEEPTLSSVLTDGAEAGIPDADLALIRDIAEAVPTQELAARLGLTERAVRYRRDRITDRLRAACRAA